MTTRKYRTSDAPAPAEKPARKQQPTGASATTIRHVALLRGVSPMNAKMSELKASFEAAGFTDVKTVLSSGNVVFNAAPASAESLAKRAETAMEAKLGRAFGTIVRTQSALQALLEQDPFGDLRLAPGSKQVITFLPTPPAKGLTLPPEVDGARIHRLEGCEVFTSYVPGPAGPIFMRLIEKTFGKQVTTRTLQTVERLSRA